MSTEPPIERAFFREAEDGTTVFFPWGLTRRGYRLSDPADKKKASRAASLLIGAPMATGTWIAYSLQPLLESESTAVTEVLMDLVAPGAVLLLALLFYWSWASRFTEGLQESDLRISRDERLREAAAAVAPGKIALIGLLLCGLSALLIWVQPHAWWAGLLGVALGVGILFWSHVLKRASAAP